MTVDDDVRADFGIRTDLHIGTDDAVWADFDAGVEFGFRVDDGGRMDKGHAVSLLSDTGIACKMPSELSDGLSHSYTTRLAHIITASTAT